MQAITSSCRIRFSYASCFVAVVECSFVIKDICLCCTHACNVCDSTTMLGEWLGG